jgi:hypothetical protein
MEFVAGSSPFLCLDAWYDVVGWFWYGANTPNNQVSFVYIYVMVFVFSVLDIDKGIYYYHSLS